MKLIFKYKSETKTCYRFESGDRASMQTLYLKKETFKDSKINHTKGLVLEITEAKDE